MLAPLLKLLGEKVKHLALGTLTSGLCTVPEVPAQLLPQLLTTAFGHSSVTPALLPRMCQQGHQLLRLPCSSLLGLLLPHSAHSALTPWGCRGRQPLPGQLRCVCTSLLPR